MTIDTTLDRAIKSDTEKLVGQVSRRWPEQTMGPIYADMKYGHYAEAVLNINASDYKEKLKLTPLKSRTVIDLIEKMKIQNEAAELARYLLESFSGQRSFEDEDVLPLVL